MPWEPHEPAPEKPQPTPPPPPPRAGNPAPGLYEALTGHPLPTFGELRDKYGDPKDLKPIQLPVCTGTETCHRADPHHHKADGWTVPVDVRPVDGGASTLTGPLAQTDLGDVDLRAMLKDSPGAILKRDRIGHVLRRPYLATQLVDLLPVEVSARLADVLTTLEHRIVEETVAAISADVTRETVSAIDRLTAEANAKREELTRERFHTGSRLD